MAERRVNLSKFIDAGLLNDADVTAVEHRFTIYDYDGKADEATCLHVTMIRDGETEPHEQYLSVGGGTAFVPSKDGKYLVANGDRESLAKRSNYQIYMDSLFKLGVDPAQVAEDISVLDGMRGHVLRVPALGREDLPGSNRKRRDGEPERKPENLIVTKLIDKLPWEKGSGKGKGATTTAKAKATPAAASAAAANSNSSGDDDDMSDKVAKIVTKLLLANGGTLKMDDLAVEAYRAFDKADRKEGAAMLTTEWLEAHADFDVEGDSVTLAG